MLGRNVKKRIRGDDATHSKRIVSILLLILAISTLPSKIYAGNDTFDLELYESHLAADIDSTVPPAPDIPDLVDSLKTGIVARNDVHFLSFTVDGGFLSPGGEVVVSFPSSFTVTGIDTIVYTDNDEFNTDFVITDMAFGARSVKFTLDSIGTAPASGSDVTVRMDSIVSPTVAQDYQVVVSVFDSLGNLLAGPTLSSEFNISPDTLAKLNIYPSNIQNITAGNTVKYSFIATDDYDNELDDLAASWSVIPGGGVTAGSISTDGVFLGTTAGFSRINCEVDYLADTSEIIYVFAGPFDHFDVTGFPVTVMAGSELDDSILVEAKDVYGNLVSQYEGDIWFETTDASAVITPNSENPYEMTALADTGDVRFPGSAFVFMTDGLHEIYLTDGINQSATTRIVVASGSVSNFSLSVPTSVTAGVPFTLSVTNIVDQAGNPLTEYVDVELITDGESPDGDLPTINGFLGEGGSGNASQTLVRAGTARFRITIGALQTLSPEINVYSADADHFSFYLTTPQIVTLPFDAPDSIAVFDRFGNVVDDFNAASDSIVIAPDGDGTVVPSVLNSDTAFVDGVCDLTRYGFNYSGSERYISFTATSESGVVGISNIVSVHSTIIDRISISPSEAQESDSITASITIVNYGDLRVYIDDVSLISDQGVMTPFSISPEPPFSIGGDSTATDIIKVVVPSEYDAGWTKFKALVQGTYNDLPISHETEYLDSIRIVSLESLSYSSSSLSPVVVTRDKTYSFLCDVSHSGLDYISLDTTSYIQIVSGEDDTLIAKLKSPTYVPATGQSATLFFREKTIPSDFASGDAGVVLELSGAHGILNYSESIMIPDYVSVQQTSAISFEDGGFTPDSAYRGTSIIPTLTLRNSGEATIVVDVDRSYLQLVSGAEEIRFTLTDDMVQLTPGENTFNFNSKAIPTLFPLESNSLHLELFGEENGHTRDASLDVGDDLIEILRQATVQLVRTCAIAPNVPRVNTEQEFDIVAVVTNEGEEPLSDIDIELSSDGTSSFIASESIDYLNVGETDSVMYEITASDEQNSAELFTAGISSATGDETGLDAVILSPLDNTVAMNIQTPAQIELTAAIDSPSSAIGGTVTAGQSFHVSAYISNSGQSQAGYGEISIVSGNEGFEIDGDTAATVRMEEVVGWDVTAPDEVGDFELSIVISETPLDSNAGTLAAVEINEVPITISVEAEQISLEATWIFGSMELVSPGVSFEALTMSIKAESESAGAEARIDSLRLRITDRNGAAVSASDILLSATVSDGSMEFSGDFNADRIRFDFGDDLIITAGEDAVDLVVSLTVSQDYDGTNLFLVFDSNAISATDISYGIEGGTVPVTDRKGESVSGSNGFGVIVNEFETSFVNYPNPFKAGEESTRLVYFIPDNSDVSLEIFTLTGESVYSEDIVSGQAGATPGQRNEVLWDGRNARGDVVLNGVYIAVLKLSSGTEAMRKIAVVK